jgi:hypothetical protein
MSHHCEICNYMTSKISNYKNHIKSRKHINNMIRNNDNLSIISENISYIQEEINIKCMYCNMTFKTVRNRSRHESTCSLRKVKETENRLEEVYKEKERAENLVMYLTKRLESITEMAINKPSNSVVNVSNILNYVSKNYINADALKSLNNYDNLMTWRKVNNTSENNYDELFDLDEDNEVNIINDKLNKVFVEDLIMFNRLKSLHSMLGNFLIENYSKKDKSQQALHVTDSSRMKYIYATLEDGMKCIRWLSDPKGVNVGKIIVDPLLEHMKKHIKYYRDKLAIRFQKHSNEITEMEYSFMEECSKLIAMISTENERTKDYCLKQKIIEYITPHFTFTKNEQLKLNN